MVAAISAVAQTTHVHHEEAATVPLQPLAQQVRRIENALEYLGQPLGATDQKRINDAMAEIDETSAVSKIQQVLDKLVLVNVEINPESRVKVERARPSRSWSSPVPACFWSRCRTRRSYAALTVKSPNSGKVYITIERLSRTKDGAHRRRCPRALGRYLHL